MASPRSTDEEKPHPATLSRLFVAHGDVTSALQVCASWRRRDPSDPRIAQVEAEARLTPRTEASPPPLDRRLAERYVQDGLLEEALIIYQRLAFFFEIDERVQQRINLLGSFLAFEPPQDPPELLLKAEAQLVERRLAAALLLFHELASSHPELAWAERRRDQLKELLREDPYARASEVNALSDTMSAALDDAADRGESPPPKRRRRFGARTQRELNVPPAIPDALAETSPSIHQKPASWVDPLDDTQQIERSGVPGLVAGRGRETPGSGPRADDLARTVRAVSPLEDPFETSRAAPDPDAPPPWPAPVIVDRSRARHRVDLVEIAERAAPLGVSVREIIVIED